MPRIACFTCNCESVSLPRKTLKVNFPIYPTNTSSADVVVILLLLNFVKTKYINLETIKIKEGFEGFYRSERWQQIRPVPGGGGVRGGWPERACFDTMRVVKVGVGAVSLPS
jgi:hypothetical protein